MSSQWEVISSISALIQTIVIVATAWFAILQIRQANQSHKLDVSIRLFDEFSSPRSRKNRAFVYSLKDRDPSQLEEEFLIIDEVLSSLDRAWILMENNQIDSKFICEAFGEIVLKTWEVTQPIVICERTRRGSYYRQRAENLVRHVRKYFKIHSKPLGYAVYSFSSSHEVYEETKNHG